MYRLLIPILVIATLVWVAIEFSDTRTRPDVVFVTGSEVFTLDPQRMSYLGDMRMGAALYEGLVRLDLDNGGFIPAAAGSWTTSDDDRVWTFTLRPQISRLIGHIDRGMPKDFNQVVFRSIHWQCVPLYLGQGREYLQLPACRLQLIWRGTLLCDDL